MVYLSKSLVMTALVCKLYVCICITHDITRCSVDHSVGVREGPHCSGLGCHLAITVYHCRVFH